LGSAQLITNVEGEEYERIEYTPYGELWVERASAASNIDIPYRFTGKERDEETGLYYYGARYLDPKFSRWLSPDPALSDYIPGAPISDEAKKRNGNLPGMGGVFNTVNLHLYHYAGNNPIKFVDPTGRTIIVGISTAKEGFDLTGAHAFIMYIDNYDPEQSLMFDPSGGYARATLSSDLVEPGQLNGKEMSVQAYIDYFEGKTQELTTFTINLSYEDEQKIKDAMLENGVRTWAKCAIKSSALLKESGLFPEVDNRKTPKGLLKDMQRYAENNEGVIINRYDFQTKKEITGE
jgi:RHS repeat-associated protein